ncbi:MAG TPA: PAS domain S-box protein [Gammaproteobacteria bacterium]
MQFYKQVIWPVIAGIVLISALVFSSSLWLLYSAAYQSELRHLQQSAKTIASLLESVAQHDRKLYGKDKAELAYEMTMQQMIQGLFAMQYDVDDVELVIGYLQEGQLQLISHSIQARGKQPEVDYDGRYAQAIYRVLEHNESGSDTLLDYHGKKVLAGYAPVHSLQLALVFKIPLAKMQLPFLRAAIWAVLIYSLMLAVFIAAFLFYSRRQGLNRQREEQRFASIIEHIPAMIYMKRASDLSFVLFNRASEEFMRVKREHVIGKTDADFFPKEQAQSFVRSEREILNKTGFLDIAEEEVDVKGRGRRILHTRKIALKNRDGEAEFLLGISEDITEQKQNAALLAESNQLINTVLDSVPVMIAYMDRQMNFVRVNQAYAQADYRTPEYFIGKNHFDLYPHAENEKLFYRVVETGEAYTCKSKPFEYVCHPERGISHWDWTLSPVKDADNNVLGVVLSLLNVSEHINAVEALQVSERKLRDLNESLDREIADRTRELETQLLRNELILNTTLEGYFAVDDHGRIRVVNPAFCRLLGYTRQEILSMSIPDFEVMENPEEVAKHIEQIEKSGHDIFDTKHRCKDGEIKDVEVSVNMVELAGEKMFYAFVRDISARIENERELIAARDEAQRANYAKSEFLSRMSHELRTPMNAILGFSQILRMQELASSQMDFIDEIITAANHLLVLIDELLDLSRIEAGNMALAIEAVDARSVLQQAIKIIQPVLTEREVTLNFECQQTVLMLADRTRLLQIFVNLLSNAAKYNKHRGEIRIECLAVDEYMLRVSFIDTGIGIAAENIDKLFQSFERLGAEKTGVDGTGVGLALSQQLAQLMGGNLGVSSVLGEGSTFWCDMPLASYTNQSGSSELAASDTVESLIKDKQVVLYIEDNPANLKVVESLFQYHSNLYLLTANNGVSGLEQAQQYQPDAILLDINLPDINGFNVLSRLRENDRTRHIPVVALSADAMPLDIERGMKAGFTDYLTKPIRLDLLIQTLDKVLKLKS